MGDLRVSFPKPCDEARDAMGPEGCSRMCARCNTIVHDLSRYTLEQAEALLRRDPAACFRARVDTDGLVALRPGATMRRMLLAAGAAGMLTAGQPAFARGKGPQGAIAGKVGADEQSTSVTATSTDGKIYHGRVKRTGRYAVKRLPAGTYKVTFGSRCGEDWTIDAVVVETDKPSVADSANPADCIIVGSIRVGPDVG